MFYIVSHSLTPGMIGIMNLSEWKSNFLIKILLKPSQKQLLDSGLISTVCFSGTLLYAAREIVIDKESPTTKSDIFAYGASMYQLFTEKYMWPLGNTRLQCYYIILI